MKNVIIFHWTWSSPQDFWFPYIKENLEKKWYIVNVPQLPGTDDPDIRTTLPFVLESCKFDEETILIWHSSGCALILSILEKINIKIQQAILVGWYASQLKDYPSLMIQDSYDWSKIKNNVNNIIFVNSDNDPWGCDDKKWREMFDNLWGTQIILHWQGHMWSTSFNQPYKEFPFLLKIID